MGLVTKRIETYDVKISDIQVTFVLPVCATNIVSEIACLRNQSIFNAHRIDCLVDRKGIGIESFIVSNFSQSENRLYNLLYLLF